MHAWKGGVAHPGAPGSQCVYEIRCHRILSVLSLYDLNSNKPRYHKGSRAYKEPQFLERGFPRVNTALSTALQTPGQFAIDRQEQ
jgi:hypothetical protein